MKKIVFSFFFIIPFLSQGQSSNDVKLTTDSLEQNIDVDFFTSKVIYNLLIHLNDSAGQTIFLDNQYKFSGYYKKGIDMKKQGKGTYYLEIIKDNEHINKKIVLK